MTIPSGCGDFLYYIVIAILLSNPEFTNYDTFYKYKKYFDVFSQSHNFLELIKIDSNTYYLFVYDVHNLKTKCYFIHELNLFNIKIDDLFKIDFFLPENDRNLNDEYYFKVCDKIGYNYIVVFNEIHRYHNIFALRQYSKEFNPENLNIIYFTDQINYKDNEYYIKDILGECKDIYYYNRIVENSRAIFCIVSYPAIYFNFIMNNINYKERFNNVQKNIYSRRFLGRNISQSYHINNINDIDDVNLILFPNFNAYYPLFFF